MKRSEIKHIADIAQIDFTEEELANFEDSFVETMDLINKIKEIDTDGVESTFRVIDEVNNLREDEVGKSLTQKEAVENTVDEKYGYFNIVKFVE
ncbi:aspartyl/glutamyl-tRNA(Asn/Gln) amidotransferase subunit C [Anaerosphaera aminiphila DSM 21120]|uniref:Aspartyl/glutamyl-tRNA(Asn/Gln) amidotransferase subunit C n=1 Tax=Anaerosphaera aminiphila DSM 21120 TaxID=1120995 RepID=A0A1M5SX95_9FIRM|nr:Asp-tRNA(Asn)/Glu-tRNA(Gln) amidotransferase subunit GatC [Anaerosphaera aminiphila]SHH43159.1 aspartyl/glutamyl-tRNA(Asn/Gln) amidotransferase subunit C [Anaerosphaera aminiphila DSM 21120]